MPQTDKLVLNFSTMWELLNVNCNYKLIRSSQISIAVKMIDSQSSPTLLIKTKQSCGSVAVWLTNIVPTFNVSHILPHSLFCSSPLRTIWETIQNRFHLLTISHLGGTECWGYQYLTLIQLVVLPQLCRHRPELSITIVLWSDINISKDQPSKVYRKYLLTNLTQPSVLLRSCSLYYLRK